MSYPYTLPDGTNLGWWCRISAQIYLDESSFHTLAAWILDSLSPPSNLASQPPAASTGPVSGTLVGLFHTPGVSNRCALVAFDLSNGSNTTLNDDVSACHGLSTTYPSHATLSTDRCVQLLFEINFFSHVLLFLFWSLSVSQNAIHRSDSRCKERFCNRGQLWQVSNLVNMCDCVIVFLCRMPVSCFFCGCSVSPLGMMANDPSDPLLGVFVRCAAAALLCFIFVCCHQVLKKGMFAMQLYSGCPYGHFKRGLGFQWAQWCVSLMKHSPDWKFLTCHPLCFSCSVAPKLLMKLTGSSLTQAIVTGGGEMIVRSPWLQWVHVLNVLLFLFFKTILVFCIYLFPVSPSVSGGCHQWSSRGGVSSRSKCS